MDQLAAGRNERVKRVNDQRGTKGSFLPARRPPLKKTTTDPDDDDDDDIVGNYTSRYYLARMNVQLSRDNPHYCDP